MKRTKKIVYNVQCAFDDNHIFEKAFFIEEGSENKQTEVEAYCPFCDKQVTVEVQGKIVPDEELLRKAGIR